MSEYGIHWFRRDLRVTGNSALDWNWKRRSGKVLGLFCFDRVFLARPDFSAARFQFFMETLRSLRDELRAAGGDLIFMDVGPDEAMRALFNKLRAKGHGLPKSLSFNRDYEPFALARDSRVSGWLERDLGIEVHTERDHVLLEPREVLKDDPSSPFYQVYTPYRKKWLEHMKTDEVHGRIEHQREALAFRTQERPFALTWPALLGADAEASDHLLAHYLRENGKRVSISLPAAGSDAAYAKIQSFKSKLEAYAGARDIPSKAGTSQLSIYLKNGSTTVPQVIAALHLDRVPESKFLSELIWREFYYSILGNFPRVESVAFQTRYEKIAWENRESWFDAWKEGRTGFPIVDAGMRQLNATGWMHNRVRMIVASFLTKDLLVDYRWGERYFMEKLLDGDLAPNNGGWQWAASTGVDPQPYFRIFNPVLQSTRFDPEGDYIRHWVPELSTLDSKQVHEPWKVPEAERNGYPDRIVDHATQSKKAIALFTVASKSKDGSRH